MNTRTYEYIGYKIIISYDQIYENYNFIVKDEKGKLLFESKSPSDHVDTAYIRACVRINDEL